MYLSLHVPTYVPSSLCTYPCTYLSMYLPMYLSLYLPTHVPISLCTYPCTYLSMYLPMYLSLYVPTYVPISLPMSFQFGPITLSLFMSLGACWWVKKWQKTQKILIKFMTKLCISAFTIGKVGERYSFVSFKNRFKKTFILVNEAPYIIVSWLIRDSLKAIKQTST